MELVTRLRSSAGTCLTLQASFAQPSARRNRCLVKERDTMRRVQYLVKRGDTSSWWRSESGECVDRKLPLLLVLQRSGANCQLLASSAACS